MEGTRHLKILTIYNSIKQLQHKIISRIVIINKKSTILITMEDVEETQPLLNSQENQSRNTLSRQSSNLSAIITRHRTNTLSSIRSGYEIVKERMNKEKFVYLILASIFIYLGFMAAFAPRTSLSKDFRWLYSSEMTEAEVYRIYLNALQDENRAEQHVHSLWKENTLEYTVDELKSMGLAPKMENYYPWVGTPVDTQVHLLKDDSLVYSATMMEECIENDPLSCHPERSRGFHEYSANGNVTAQYIFCNYGTLEDYGFLLKNNIDTEDKIHIIRYGKMYRGLKVRNAELYGASSVILYTDPYDDGDITEKNGFQSYPEGPARPLDSIERGAVGYFTDFPGDPTSPGFAAKSRNTEHLSPAGKIPRIPSVPLSAKEVAPLLQELNGNGIQFGPGGNIEGFQYFTGPSNSNVQVQLYNEQDYSIMKMTDITIDIPGIFSEGKIIIGSHRDNQINGTSNGSNSGTAIMLEVARGLSALLDKGWKPLRPIQLISWDGSEAGLLGSTEYTDDHGAILKRNTLAYLNLDNPITGSEFECKASPLLEEVLSRAAKSTDYKGSSTWSLLDEWKKTSNGTVNTLGGGSDFMSFQYHLGIPSANFEFKNDGTKDAIYPMNSNYDNYEWIERFVDPKYKLHNTMARFTGLSALILSESELIPFKTHEYLDVISKWYHIWYDRLPQTFPHDKELSELAKEVDHILKSIRENESIVFDTNSEDIKCECTYEYAIWQFYKKIRIYTRLLRANYKLLQFDRIFLSVKGLTDREYMKHSIYAPNKLLGYPGDVLPGIHEGLDEFDRDAIIEWLTILLIQFNNIKFLLQ